MDGAIGQGSHRKFTKSGYPSVIVPDHRGDLNASLDLPCRRLGMATGGRWCMCGRRLGCKRKSENSDGQVDCDHVSGLVDAAS